MNKLIASLLFTVFLTVGGVKAADTISGKVEKGLRILAVSTGEKPLSYTVYRGDYIKFSNLAKSVLFQMPKLQYKDTVHPELDKSNYFKMKEVGVFDFLLGKRPGKINVMEYQEANYKAVSAKEAQDLISSVKPFLLDVRTSAEYQNGHIAGSTLIPIQVLQFKAQELKQYKNQDILIYCASGNRSTVAAKILIDQGFKRIYNMRYGLIEWVRSGYQLKK